MTSAFRMSLQVVSMEQAVVVQAGRRGARKALECCMAAAVQPRGFPMARRGRGVEAHGNEIGMDYEPRSECTCPDLPKVDSEPLHPIPTTSEIRDSSPPLH